MERATRRPCALYNSIPSRAASANFARVAFAKLPNYRESTDDESRSDSNENCRRAAMRNNFCKIEFCFWKQTEQIYSATRRARNCVAEKCHDLRYGQLTRPCTLLLADKMIQKN